MLKKEKEIININENRKDKSPDLSSSKSENAKISISEDIINDHYFGDREMFKEVSEVYLKNISNHLSNLESSIQRKDTCDITRFAHLIKGSVGVFYCYEIISQFQEIEEAGKSGNPEEALRIFHKAKEDFSIFNESLIHLSLDNSKEMKAG